MKAGNSKQTRRWRQWIDKGVWLWLVCICSFPTTPASAADESADPSDAPVAQEIPSEQQVSYLDAPIVLSVTGRVETLFAGEQVPVRPLASLAGVERVTLIEASTLRGVCPSLTVFEMRGPGNQAIPCPPPERPRLSQLAPMRYVVDSAVPRMLSPRSGFVRSPPTIRWSLVPGVSLYRLELRDETFAVQWKQTVQGTQLPYPESAPAMLPGQMYSFRVATEQRSSDEDNTDQVFQVMSVAGRERVQAAERRLAALNLTPNGQRHVLARLLMHFELYAEAFDILQDGKDGSSAVSFGQLLTRTGLHSHARKTLSDALTGAAPDLSRAQLRQLLAELGDEQSAPRKRTR